MSIGRKVFRDVSTDVPRGLPLVILLTGFIDAGRSVATASRHLIDSTTHERVWVFDNDELLDYRARRPTFTFEQTKLTDYRPPELVLRLVTDELGLQFLLLTGYEPDYRWEAAAEAVVTAIETFEVSATTWVHAIPMPVPHTRPVGMTVSGNRDELIEQYSVWRPTTEVPGTFVHLVEFMLTALGHPTAGFVLLIPHYLADADYPAGTVAVLDAITTGTGISLRTDALREAGREFLTDIADQVTENYELAKLISNLESRHDTYMLDNPAPSPFVDEEGHVPSAESIAAELENFLRTRGTSDD
ncbi:MAG: PAC2 family protein [Microbacteriaceae bacterium]|nr:PAC2 family protein [Microbacteriaceae bacterium]